MPLLLPKAFCGLTRSPTGTPTKAPSNAPTCDLQRTEKFLTGRGSTSNKAYAPTETIRRENVEGCDDEMSETIGYIEAFDGIMSKLGEWNDP